MLNHVVPLDELQERTTKFAKRMAFISPEALGKMKLAINCTTDSAGSRNTKRRTRYHGPALHQENQTR
jgi:1,4-dihydroxy-2-naphthoyl-CoA synthase